VAHSRAANSTRTCLGATRNRIATVACCGQSCCMPPAPSCLPHSTGFVGITFSLSFSSYQGASCGITCLWCCRGGVRVGLPNYVLISHDSCVVLCCAICAFWAVDVIMSCKTTHHKYVSCLLLTGCICPVIGGCASWC
jgi:hypothetical protein